MQFEIFKFKKVTSTNDVAIRLIKEKKKEIGCIYADEQTKGRGTQGKKWISSKGNFYGSFFFPLKNKYPPFSEFTIINPVIISNVVKNFCDEKKISIRWPNDVFINKKKFCGILQELITIDGKKFLIIGIGINIISNPTISNKYKATNILRETKKKPSVKRIINLLISSYKNFFKDINTYNYTTFKKKAELMVLN